IERIQGSIDYLNKLYRDIIKFTSPAPDPNRDYELTKRPGLDMVERMTWAANELADISKSIETISGTNQTKPEPSIRWSCSLETSSTGREMFRDVCRLLTPTSLLWVRFLRP
ncbi:MAG TPA: hypothetical protein PLK86_05730, partial [Bacilli bacterium]|nr:hypothetical protein [Bacilli bacterium]